MGTRSFRPLFVDVDPIRLGEINQERANAAYRAREAFAAHLFDPSTRRSRPTAGRPDTIRPLTNEHVAEFYRNNIGPDRAEILFAGDATGVDVAPYLSPLALAVGVLGALPAVLTPVPASAVVRQEVLA